MEILKTDVLIIGGGGAGMRAALAAKEKGAEVLLVSKTPIGKSTCTYWELWKTQQAQEASMSNYGS